MEDDDDDILYCHEDPLLVDSTPQLPAAAGGDDDDHTTTTTSSSRSGLVGLNPQPAPPAAEDVVVVVDRGEEEADVELLVEHLGRQRQGCYAPSRGYLEHLLPPPPPSTSQQGSSASAAIIIPAAAADDGDGGVAAARSRGVHYITYAFGRLGLGAATVFNAVNYLDRFLSINCHLRWEWWMVELVSVACLSIACKLDEVNIPSLHDLQMEEVLSHSFRPATIRDMELTLLKALQWRLACVTPYSFLRLLLPCLLLNITEAAAAAAAYSSCCTRLLIRALAEPSLLLRFDSSLIAASALRCVSLAQQQLQQQDHLYLQQTNNVSSSDHIISQLLQQDITKDDGHECLKMMQALYDDASSYHCLLDHHPINSHHHQFYCLYSSHQKQWSPVPVIIVNPSQADDDGRTTVNRSAVSRRLFGGSINTP